MENVEIKCAPSKVERALAIASALAMLQATFAPLAGVISTVAPDHGARIQAALGIVGLVGLLSTKALVDGAALVAKLRGQTQ